MTDPKTRVTTYSMSVGLDAAKPLTRAQNRALGDALIAALEYCRDSRAIAHFGVLRFFRHSTIEELVDG